MDKGGDKSEGPQNPDNTTPLDVAKGELRSSTDRTRYHSTDNDSDDVERDDVEDPAQYSNTPVLGTATLEVSCRGETAALQGASLPELDVMTSAGQSGKNSDRQRQAYLSEIIHRHSTLSAPFFYKGGKCPQNLAKISTPIVF